MGIKGKPAADSHFPPSLARAGRWFRPIRSQIIGSHCYCTPEPGILSLPESRGRQYPICLSMILTITMIRENFYIANMKKSDFDVRLHQVFLVNIFQILLVSGLRNPTIWEHVPIYILKL